MPVGNEYMREMRVPFLKVTIDRRKVSSLSHTGIDKRGAAIRSDEQVRVIARAGQRSRIERVERDRIEHRRCASGVRLKADTPTYAGAIRRVRLSPDRG